MDSKPLLSGQEFEILILGVANEYDPESNPPYLDFDASMQEVIGRPLIRVDDDGKPVEEYDPGNPTWGKTGEIWRAVKKHLPKKTAKGSSGPLFLYIAVGGSPMTILDNRHGVDAFFWWEGAYATFDVAIFPKRKNGRKEERLKADCWFGMDTLNPGGLDAFGKQIAEILKGRRRANRQYKRKDKRKSRVSTAELEEQIG